MASVSNEILDYFARFIENELGIIYADHNYFQLQNRLEQVAIKLSLESVDAMFVLAQKGITPEMRLLLLDLATNNETSFFRDPKLFSALEDVILKGALVSPKPLLNIWSAASSTGQEALSVAILIEEFNFNRKSKGEQKIVDYKIIGTDISERVLAKAKSHVYSPFELQRGLAPELMRKYFRQDSPDVWKASVDLTRRIEFKKMNLKDPFSFANAFDLILCRNVLIYQHVKAKQVIVERISQALSPCGYLILGSGESLVGISDEFEQESVGGAIIYRKRATSARVSA